MNLRENLKPFQFFVTLLDARAKRTIAILLGSTALMSLLSAGIPYFAKLQLDQLSQPNTPLYDLPATPIMLFLAFLLIPTALMLIHLLIQELGSTLLHNRLAEQLENSTRKKLWEKLYNFDAGFLESERNQFLFGQAMDSFRLPDDVFQFLRRNVEFIVTLGAIFPLLAFIDPLLLVLVALGAVVNAYFSKKNFETRTMDSIENAQLYRQHERVNSMIRYEFQQLKQLGVVKQFIELQAQLAEQNWVVDQRQSMQRARFMVAQRGAQDLIALFVNLFVGYQVFAGNLSLGSFAITVAYTQQLTSTLQRFWYAMEDWQNIGLNYFRLQFFFTLPSRWKQPDNPKTIAEPQAVSLQKVSFQYPDYYTEEREYLKLLKEKISSSLKKSGSQWYLRDTLKELDQLLAQPADSDQVLHGIDITLTRGSVTALLGRNGAGKTTITRLLMHHYEPDKGTVVMDDQSLNELDQEWMFRQFGILTQNPFVLHRFSIQENLLLGVDREVSEKELWEVLDTVGLKTAVQKAPKQLGAVLGEDTRLSGGQTQLLALARVLLQKRPFIILDEGTSQLDVENEAKILQLLTVEAKENNAAVLFITHRITTARKADQLIVIDSGHVKESGTHAELLKQDGIYSQFWQLQVVE